MSKLTLTLLILASLAIYDPQRVMNLFGPQANWIGYKLNSWFDVGQNIPALRRH
jgi:hypothetical protein